MKVVAFNGSGRKDGNTAILLRVVLKKLEENDVETELVQLAGQTIRGCRACYKCKDLKNKQCSIKNDCINITIYFFIIYF